MKKTLIALLALSGVASADVLVNVMQNSQGVTTWGGDEALSLTSVSGIVNITNQSGNAMGSTTYSNSVLKADTNVGNGGTYTYTLTFTTDFGEGVTGVTLDSFVIDMFSLNAGGKTQNADETKDCKFTYSFTGGDTQIMGTDPITVGLRGAASVSAEDGTPAYTLEGDQYVRTAIGQGSGSVSGGQTTVTFSQAVALKNDTQYQFVMNVDRVSVGGFYTGIGNVALNGTASQVPEPATGTLSLLALAGLCARRRKK